ncbi:unnamed protein product, partial [marine sediment metagenome]
RMPDKTRWLLPSVSLPVSMLLATPELAGHRNFGCEECHIAQVGGKGRGCSCGSDEKPDTLSDRDSLCVYMAGADAGGRVGHTDDPPQGSQTKQNERETAHGRRGRVFIRKG